VNEELLRYNSWKDISAPTIPAEARLALSSITKCFQRGIYKVLASLAETQNYRDSTHRFPKLISDFGFRKAFGDFAVRFSANRDKVPYQYP
jgi:hypothetical protein